MNGNFNTFLSVSLLVHALVFSAFIRVIQTPDEEDISREMPADSIDDSEFADEETVDYKMFESLLSPYMDSAVIESLWQTDSLSIKQWGAYTETEPAEYNKEWYEERFARSKELQEFLENYLRQPDSDSLFAQSEFLRRAAVEQILKHLNDSALQKFYDENDWEKLIDGLAERLEKIYGKGLKDLMGNEGLFSRMVTNPELMKLWKESMLFSLQEEAMDRMREMMREALKQCLARCGLLPGRGGKKNCEYPSSGKGGTFPGNDEIPDVNIQDCFRETIPQIGGSGFTLFGTLFIDKKKLAGELGKEALEMARSMLGSDVPFSALTEIDFTKAIAEALEQREKIQGGMGQIEEFLQTLQQGLGEDIAAWFRDGPSELDLKQNPYYYSQWARDYLDLVSKLAASPNLLMPNLAKYAEAAKKIRERYLAGTTTLGIGKGAMGKAEKEDYTSPRQVFLTKNIKKSDTLQTYTPLIKTRSYSNAWGGAVRRTTPIVIDGNLNEWRHCRLYAIYGSGQGLKKLPPEMQNCNCLMVQWDNRGIYFAYQIYDNRDNPHNVATFWDTDALEIFIDPLNHKDSHRINGRSFQFWVWPRAYGVQGSTGQSVFSSPHAFIPKPLKKGLIQFGSIRKGNQYTCEVFVPAVLCEKWYPLPGKSIGFNYSINNGEGVLIRWVTNMGRNISVSPDLWGDLLLMGSDAIVTLSPADFILPGQNVTVTITDHDMNLKSNTRDKIWIKIASRLTSDKLPVTCIETGNNTGVFVAEVGTVFALKPREKDRLSVRPGDILQVYYLDQHGSGGKKNVPEVREINVGRGVFSFGN